MKKSLLLAGFLAPVCFSLSCSAEPAKKDDYLGKAIEALGGYSKYRRMESLRYDFMETVVTQAGPVTISGRHYFRIAPDARLSGRVETSSPAGQTLTVFNSTGFWHWDNGNSVEDPQVLEMIREDILQKAFWTTAPFRVKQAGFKTEYAGLGYLNGKLDRRLDVETSFAPALPRLANFTLYLDSGTFALDGATVPLPDGRGTFTVLLERYVATKNIGLPTRRITLGPDNQRISTFSILQPVVNVFFDDALLDPSAVKPAPGSGSPAP